MSDLVSKVAQQRAIRFVQLHPTPLALSIVGFHDIDRDDSRVMTRQRRLVVRRVFVRTEFERQSMVGVLGLGCDGQAQLRQPVHEASLRSLKSLPTLDRSRSAEIRND